MNFLDKNYTFSTIWIAVTSNIGGFELCKQKSPTHSTFFPKWSFILKNLTSRNVKFIKLGENIESEKKNHGFWTTLLRFKICALMHKLREFWMECCVRFKYFWSGSTKMFAIFFLYFWSKEKSKFKSDSNMFKSHSNASKMIQMWF